MLDSGGFQFIRQLGKYPLSPEEYLKKVALLQPDIFVIQDWMCEPSQVQRTGLSVREHIRRTVENYLYIYESLQKAEEDIKGYCIPVIQGWEQDDYFSCIDLYEDYGLIAPYMAVGSVCRRGKTAEIKDIIENIHAALPRTIFHGLGVKKQVLVECDNLLHSCDTAAGQYLKKDINGRWITTKNGYYQMLQRYYFELSCLNEMAANEIDILLAKQKRDREKGWHSIRDGIKERDGEACQVCGSIENLEVHHIKKWDLVKEHSPNNLITLCKACHRKCHRLTSSTRWTRGGEGFHVD